MALGLLPGGFFGCNDNLRPSAVLGYYEDLPMVATINDQEISISQIGGNIINFHQKKH
ncbi:hypothetical protein [Echinicola vietnamensis]|uniref:Uncharacterized protein n=1 Tax=Echinicola vietnamensis (strain DSM 17526 / LMG 23754 / KMM 6221) TaxID=926556 RepID=L0FYU9_ECHVK|nr:hypothetical protein [Echinicola vietnamensis]AGA78472.1 hypothetical protein Echvi_2222 [Echinicola vietnamensis DSM 17526]